MRLKLKYVVVRSRHHQEDVYKHIVKESIKDSIKDTVDNFMLHQFRERRESEVEMAKTIEEEVCHHTTTHTPDTVKTKTMLK